MWKKGVVMAGNLSVEAARSEAVKAGYAVYVLPSTGIIDRSSFFEALSVAIPLDPDAGIMPNWDGMLDSLRGGLMSIDAHRIAILWPGSQALATLSRSDFDHALKMWHYLAEDLASTSATGGCPKRVSVVIM